MSPLKCSTWNSHLPPTLPSVLFPRSCCITCYVVQPVISPLPGDPLRHSGCGLAARGSREPEGKVLCWAAEERALSPRGTPSSSSRALRAGRHRYAPSRGAEQGGCQLCTLLILFYFSCRGRKVIKFLWKIRTWGEKRLFDGRWDIVFLVFPMPSY